MTDENKTEEEPSIEEILSSIRDIISDEDEDGDGVTSSVATTPEKEVDKKTEEVKAEAADKTPKNETPDNTSDSSESSDEDDDILDLTDLVEEGSEPLPEEDMSEEEKTDDSKDPLAGIDLSHPDDDLDVSESETIDEDGLADIFGIDADDAPVEDKIETVDEVETVDAVETPKTPDIAEDTPDVAPLNDYKTSEDEGLVNKIVETATVGAMAKLAENIAISKKSSGTTLEDIVHDLLRPMLKDWLDSNLPNLIEGIVAKELERLAEKAARK